MVVGHRVAVVRVTGEVPLSLAPTAPCRLAHRGARREVAEVCVRCPAWGTSVVGAECCLSLWSCEFDECRGVLRVDAVAMEARCRKTCAKRVLPARRSAGRCRGLQGVRRHRPVNAGGDTAPQNLVPVSARPLGVFAVSFADYVSLHHVVGSLSTPEGMFFVTVW